MCLLAPGHFLPRGEALHCAVDCICICLYLCPNLTWNLRLTHGPLLMGTASEEETGPRGRILEKVDGQPASWGVKAQTSQGAQVDVALVSTGSSIPNTSSKDSQQGPTYGEGTDQEHCGHIRDPALPKVEGDLLVASCFLEVKGSHCGVVAFKAD